jgi:hypothetical protein
MHRDMSTPDQLLCVALNGTAMRCAAEKYNLADSIAELGSGCDDVLAEAAGIRAGSWYAWRPNRNPHAAESGTRSGVQKRPSGTTHPQIIPARNLGSDPGARRGS